MFASKLAAVVGIASILGAAAPAKADVIYNLTFAGGGTGVLDLNFGSIAQAENLSYTSITPYFVSLTATNVNGQNFTITPGNLADGYIQSGSSGQLYTLTVEEVQPTGVPNGTKFLDVYTSSWQIHNTPYDAYVTGNNLSISAPTLGSSSTSSSVPEPSGVAGIAAGLCGIVFLASRKRRATNRLAA